MITKTVYICACCSTRFDDPCEAHEIECRAEKEREALRAKAAARVAPLCDILLGETTDDPIGAKINGLTLLITTPFTVKTVKAISVATELVSTASNPSERDASLIAKANKILSHDQKP